MGLTHLALQKAESREKPYKLYDQGGLYVIVSPSGSKLWRMDYRFAGKRKTLAFGQWPKVTLQEARRRRDEARDVLDADRDPGAAAPASTAPTFEAVGRKWFAMKTESIVSSYASRIETRLEQDIYPQIGGMPIDLIEPPALLLAIRKIEDRGAIELAKRVKNYCGEIFRYGIGEGWCKRDPSRDITGSLKQKPRTKHRAKLRMKDMAEFITAVTTYRSDTLARQALLLTLQTVARTQETRFAAWDQFEDLDGPEPIWRVPSRIMKERLPHLVPLSRQTVELLKQIPRRGDLLFESDTRSGTISENAMLTILYSRGYMGKMTVHGIRGTFSTAANESGLWHEDWIEKALAHVEENEVRSAYNEAEYLEPRRRLLQWWNDLLFPENDFDALL